MKIVNDQNVSQKQNKYLLLLIALLIAGTLVSINTFGPATLSAYFFYTILGSLVAVIAGIGGNPLAQVFSDSWSLVPFSRTSL